MQNDKVWIMGPCALESEEMYIETGQKLSKLMTGKEFYYKASWDKANRTSLHGARGIGMEDAIPIFQRIKTVL